MPKGPTGQKRLGDVSGAAIKVAERVDHLIMGKGGRPVETDLEPHVSKILRPQDTGFISYNHIADSRCSIAFFTTWNFTGRKNASFTVFKLAS